MRPALSFLAILWACGSPDATDVSGTQPKSDQGSKNACVAQKKAPEPLPDVQAAHRTAKYWIERNKTATRAILTAAEIERHNGALQRRQDDGPIGQADLDASPIAADVFEQVRTRISYMRAKLDSKEYVDKEGKAIVGAALAAFSTPESATALTSEGALTPEDKLADGEIALHCGPRLDGLYKSPVDLAFDRNRCSTIRKGERVQLLATWGDLRLARTSYALGWIDANAPLSNYDKDRVTTAAKKLTYEAVVQEAFQYLGRPYGWGGQGGAQDCSRFIMDVLEPFGVRLPRNSGRQALAGSYAVSLEGVDNLNERISLIDEASKDGVVLLHFPGHIMLYLGRNDSGEPMAIHAFSEYLERCPGDGSDIVVRADRVDVSDLRLGEHSSRTSFLERITLVTVIGKHPRSTIKGAATLRPAVEAHEAWDKLTRGNANSCQDNVRAAMFRSPTPVHSEGDARVIATFESDPGFAELFLKDPSGNWTKAPSELRGGPPYTFVSTLHKPLKGRWTAIVADGEEVLACERFNVRRSPLEPVTHTAAAPRTLGAWEDSWKWELDTENLYAAFVERLFDEPKASDSTWPDLHTLLRDPKRNLLYNHLGLSEDDSLELGPDCADLPYFLRAYFAWKVGLPFGYRRCSRGKAGTPPACNEVLSNRTPLLEEKPEAENREPQGSASDPSTNDSPSLELMERNNKLNALQAFSLFSRRLASGVHSASARTHPKAEATDVYPVALRRPALKPGTVFADPYGHLLVIAKWWPQTATEYGVLVGADAQPDGTIGRRRFWRGTFLFTPKTDDVGAGFKAWRPLVEAEDGILTVLTNDELKNSKTFAPYSLEQYGDSRDTFYAKVEALINPRPLDPMAYMTTLVDALDESIKRRMVSVQNGIDYMREHNWAVIAMPDGHDVFETEGAWEDYSTPARDLRLLVSLDAVLQFPNQVASNPARFGVAASDAKATQAKLRENLGLLLAARRYTYERSNGKRQEIRLADIAQRSHEMEMAYNPNDCIEVRWGAPEGSDERASCDRRAPEPQQAKMNKYRAWFKNRERPPR